jgi:AbrB family looped-hinge helix DNA binding protein
MHSSKLTSKFQTTIPKEIREFLGLKAGDTVTFVQRGNEIVLKPRERKLTLQDFKGIIVPPPDSPKDWDSIRKIARERALKKKGLIK